MHNLYNLRVITRKLGVSRCRVRRYLEYKNAHGRIKTDYLSIILEGINITQICKNVKLKGLIYCNESFRKWFNYQTIKDEGIKN